MSSYVWRESGDRQMDEGLAIISLDGDAKKYFIGKNAGDDSAQKLNVPNYSSASTIALFWNK